jgi:hypothetical protein
VFIVIVDQRNVIVVGRIDIIIISSYRLFYRAGFKNPIGDVTCLDSNVQTWPTLIYIHTFNIYYHQHFNNQLQHKRAVTALVSVYFFPLSMMFLLRVIVITLVLCQRSDEYFAIAFSVSSQQQSSTARTIQVNDKLPLVDLHYGFPPQYVNSAFYAANKNLLILCLPGAFTPT